MLLIVSENFDASTSKVIDWLLYSKTPFVRINDSTNVFVKKIVVKTNKINWIVQIEEPIIQLKRTIQLKEISSYWYRRGYINLPFSIYSDTQTGNYISPLKEYINYNNADLIRLIYDSLALKTNIGSPYDNSVSKLDNIQIAAEVGLNVPATTIVTSKRSLIDFKKKYNKIITKGIKSNSVNVSSNATTITSLTQLLKDKDIRSFPVNFGPSLIQEYVPKLFELRIFYFDKKCFTTVIYSQVDKTTSVDFRNYNKKRPNRVVPYILPTDIEKKIVKFMTKIKIRSGSIDILVSDKLQYYFLEVNPVGQFDWISKNCNLQLEKIIADYFSNEKNN